MPEYSRKTPRQRRAAEAFHSVLTAASRLLPDLGYQRLTTNRIAELAGVSIGSLYQYFENKDAIALELFQKILGQNQDGLKAALEECRGCALDVALDRLVAKMVDRMLEKKTLLDLLYLYAPRIHTTRVVVGARKNVMVLLQEFLDQRARELAVTDTRAASEVLVLAFLGVIHGHILDKESSLDRDTLVRELSGMAKRYLIAPAPTRS